jgi:NAD(P)-dependent dehydrogenase (short-subunit alcohol dehydrogenase family)
MNIVITGASSGIGYYTALALSNNPENKIIAIARNNEKLLELEKNSLNNNIKIIVFDLSEYDFSLLIHEISKLIRFDFGEKIDVLINNAAHLIKKHFIDITMEDWARTFQINLFSITKIIQALYPYFNKTQGAHIVNIASMGGVLGSKKFSGLSAYSASKAAVNSLTESLAVEFKIDNIHINAISPGSVQTKMLEKAFPGFKAQISANEMGEFVADFAMNYGKLMNGRIIQASLES